MSTVRPNGVTVLLDGQGADETLAGYSPFAIHLSDLLAASQFGAAYREAQALATGRELGAGQLLAYAAAWRLPPAAKRAALSVWHALRRRPATAASVINRRLRAVVGTDGDKLSEGTAGQSLDEHLLGLVQSSLPNLLRYEDRNSMAFSVEARVPFLDYRLVGLAFNQVAPWRIHDGWSKWVLRQAMAGQVPGDVLWRRDKVGFATPELRWLREWPAAENPLLGSQPLSAAYLDLQAVQERFRAGISTPAMATEAWRWINLETWLRVWTARPPSAE
jgi:asparagine synthase (glutamine-hydrolysing)